jgi:putative NADH-flavin reductase
MKITVFGATGRIGALVVSQALDAGHPVTAVVRDAAKLDAGHPALRVVTVPGLADPAPLRPALDGSDAVISAVGPRRRTDVGVATTATHGILQAMAATGVRRLVAVSATPVGPTPEGEGWLDRRILSPLLHSLLRNVYTDLAAMEDEIRRSGTDWTVVRPPRLLDRPATGRYRSVVDGNVRRGRTIARADVAHAMLVALSDPSTIGHALGIAD